MSYSYADKDETIQDAGLGPTLSEDNQETVERIIQAASALIDQYTNRPPGYFAALDDESEPTERRYRGNGKNYLQVGRHVAGSMSITNFDDSLWYEETNGWPYMVEVTAQPGFSDYVNTGPGFAKGAVYVVSARWGFAATPDDIILATKQIVQHVWDRGKGVIGQITPAGFVIERDMPLTARTILDRWIKREFEVN